MQQLRQLHHISIMGHRTWSLSQLSPSEEQGTPWADRQSVIELTQRQITINTNIHTYR